MRWKKIKNVSVYVYGDFKIVKQNGLWEVYFDGKYIGCSSTFNGAENIVRVYG